MVRAGAVTTLVIFVSLLALDFYGQQAKPITNSDVVAMVNAGLDESTILLSIKRGPTAFDTSPGALVQLKKASVGSAVLNAMIAAHASGSLDNTSPRVTNSPSQNNTSVMSSNSSGESWNSTSQGAGYVSPLSASASLGSWEPAVGFDGNFFPAVPLATSGRQASSNDPHRLGDMKSSIAVIVKTPGLCS